VPWRGKYCRIKLHMSIFKRFVYAGSFYIFRKWSCQTRPS
jgi:hypothetical protein